MKTIQVLIMLLSSVMYLNPASADDTNQHSSALRIAINLSQSAAAFLRGDPGLGQLQHGCPGPGEKPCPGWSRGAIGESLAARNGQKFGGQGQIVSAHRATPEDGSECLVWGGDGR